MPIVTIHRISGRLVVFLKESISKEEARQIANFISRVPGVARVSCGFKTPKVLESINEAAILALTEAQPFETFKVQARRAHTDFPINSMEINKLVGSVLCDAFPESHVKMKGQDVEVGIEVVQNAAYIFAYSMRGIGGLPVGVSGRVCCLLSSGIDSPVAAWRMARRGASVIALHFSGRPETSDESEYLVQDIAKILQKTSCIKKLYIVPIGTYQHEISLYAPPPLRVILYRRLMMKCALKVSATEGAGAIVTGESLGQVASQTLDNIACTDEVCDIPVFRPLIGTDKQEIIDQAQELGTFDISTQNAPDCCTLFMPRNPETHAKLEDVLKAEAPFPEDEWVQSMLKEAEVIQY